MMQKDSDWQYDYAPDTGHHAICPKCRSDDVWFDHEERGWRTFFECNSCGYRQDIEDTTG